MDPMTEPLPKSKVFAHWMAENRDLDPNSLDKLPEIHYAPVSWRSFLSPLKPSDNGMHFFTDFIQFITLSIFSILTNVDHSITELRDLIITWF